MDELTDALEHLDQRTAVHAEVDKLKSEGLDVNLYVYTGHKHNKVTWEQISTPHDKYMHIEYKADTGELSPNWKWDQPKSTTEL